MTGDHAVRLGVSFRGVIVKDVPRSNFNGTFIFAGGLASRLLNGQIVLGANGLPILEYITSAERYRRTLSFRQQGLSPSDIRLRGGGHTQFSINGGNAVTTVSQSSLSGFIQDEWRLRPTLGLSYGLRFETQSNIGRNFDIAPRIAFAWARETDKKHKLRAVLRGGFGVFYSRIGENLVLDAIKFDGEHVQSYRINDPNILDSFVNVPQVQDLVGLGRPISTRQIAGNIRAPVSYHAALSFEHELPGNSVFTATYSDLRGRHVLRSRNINAPFLISSQRPIPSFEDIYQYESNGNFNSRRLSLNFTTRFWKFRSLYLRYDLGTAKSDTDGAANFPVNQYNSSEEVWKVIT
ncbi:MAG: hypothetical protein WBD22_08410 [Pyrinomonadaceae bacterium]